MGKYIDQLLKAQGLGEESGRAEASDEYPDVPDLETMERGEYIAFYRAQRQQGQARAQGLYGLHGRAARRFSDCWALGFIANCFLLQEEADDEVEEAEETAQIAGETAK